MQDTEKTKYKVKCVNGIYADAETGYLIPDKYHSKIHYVNKDTLETYYTVLYLVGKLWCAMFVLSSRHVTKHGMVWDVTYFTEFYTETCEMNEYGRGHFRDWYYRIYESESNAVFWDISFMLKNVNESYMKRRMMKYLGSDVDTRCRVSDYNRKCALGFYAKTMGEKIFKLDDSICKRFDTCEEVFAKLYKGELAEYTCRDMGELPFGVEIEFTGMSRQKASITVARTLNTKEKLTRPGVHEIKDSKGRIWTVKSDSSITAEDKYGHPTRDTFKCELVTPILNNEDLTTLTGVVCGLKKAGMRVNKTCGIHIHVGSLFTSYQLINLYSEMCSRQELLNKALNINVSRKRYCKDLNPDMFEFSNKHLFINVEIMRKWYGLDDSRSKEYVQSQAHFRYDSSRYSMLNFHSYFAGKGVEFRCFNSTTDDEEIRAYIDLCLAMCSYAKKALRVNNVSTKVSLVNLRSYIYTLELRGKEYAATRKILTRYLKDDVSGITS